MTLQKKEKLHLWTIFQNTHIQLLSKSYVEKLITVLFKKRYSERNYTSYYIKCVQ